MTSSSSRFEDLQRRFEENPRRYFAPLANEFRQADNARRAVELCRTFLPQMPEHLSGHVVLGLALRDLGATGEAHEAFEQVLTLDPENVLALRTLGDLARDAGDPVAARRWYGRLLDVDPRDPDAAASLAAMDPVGAAAIVPGMPTPARTTPAAANDPVAMPDAALDAQQEAEAFTAGFFAEVLDEDTTTAVAAARTADMAASTDGDLSLPPLAGIEDPIFEEPAIEEPPVDEAPVEEPPVEEPPVDEAPVEEAPGEDEALARPIATEFADDREAAGELAAREPAPASAFVTETMAALYLRQGFADEARRVYDELIAASPDDAELRVRASAALGDAAPDDSAPDDSAPDDSAPGDAAPGDAAPGDAAPEDAAAAAPGKDATPEPVAGPEIAAESEATPTAEEPVASTPDVTAWVEPEVVVEPVDEPVAAAQPSSEAVDARLTVGGWLRRLVGAEPETVAATPPAEDTPAAVLATTDAVDEPVVGDAPDFAGDALIEARVEPTYVAPGSGEPEVELVAPDAAAPDADAWIDEAALGDLPTLELAMPDADTRWSPTSAPVEDPPSVDGAAEAARPVTEPAPAQSSVEPDVVEPAEEVTLGAAANDTDGEVAFVPEADDPFAWGDEEPVVAAAAPAPAESADVAPSTRPFSLDDLAGRPADAADEAAAGALVAATLSLQDDPAVEAQLREASAEDPGSLDHLLRAPPSASGGMRPTPSFSFEQFFRLEGESAGTPAVPEPRPEPEAPRGERVGEAGDDDLDEFHAWLSGLSRP